MKDRLSQQKSLRRRACVQVGACDRCVYGWLVGSVVARWRLLNNTERLSGVTHIARIHGHHPRKLTVRRSSIGTVACWHSLDWLLVVLLRLRLLGWFDIVQIERPRWWNTDRLSGCRVSSRSRSVQIQSGEVANAKDIKFLRLFGWSWL